MAPFRAFDPSCIELRTFPGWDIKTVLFREVEDNLRLLRKESGLSSMAIHHLCSHLKAFYRWLVDRVVIKPDQAPRFPEVGFGIGWRKITDKATQDKILEEVWWIGEKMTPRALSAIFLCSCNVTLARTTTGPTKKGGPTSVD
jgi:hypothetical protein